MAAKKSGEPAVVEMSAETTAEVPVIVAPPAAPEPPAAVGALPAAAPATAAKAFPLAAPAAAEQFDNATTKVKASMDKAMKTAEDLVTFGQGNFEAMVKSSQIWAAGVQDLGKQVAATAQAQMDQTMATLKAFAGIKSLKEAMELQTSLARATMETAVAETGKLTDASIKLAEQTMAPLAARVTLAAERFGRVV